MLYHSAYICSLHNHGSQGYIIAQHIYSQIGQWNWNKMHFTKLVYFYRVEWIHFYIWTPEPTHHTKQTQVGAMKKAIILPWKCKCAHINKINKHKSYSSAWAMRLGYIRSNCFVVSKLIFKDLYSSECKHFWKSITRIRPRPTCWFIFFSHCSLFAAAGSWNLAPLSL